MSGWMKYPYVKACVDCDYYDSDEFDYIVNHPHEDCRSEHDDCPGKNYKCEKCGKSLDDSEETAELFEFYGWVRCVDCDTPIVKDLLGG